MSFETELSSNTFDIEDTRGLIDLDRHFHKAEMEIIKKGQPRKVIFGKMEAQERSVYEIVSPYLATMAKTTGNIAYGAGSIAFEYLKQGFWWFYDQITNKVIPYTKEQIPKLIFIIAKSAKRQNSIKSGEFCVLEMQDEDYKQIAKKQRQKQGPIKVLVPLGNKDEALIQEIKKNYEVSYSFPIEDLASDSESMSITYCIPSESYEILEHEAKETLKEEKQKELQALKMLENQKITENEKETVKQSPEDLLNEKFDRKKSQEDWQDMKMSVVRQKSELKSKLKPKAIILPDACCFIYEQEDELYPMLREGLERDANAVAGHLISSEKYKNRESHDSSEGEAPMITVEQKIGKNIKVIEKVEVEIKEEPLARVVDTERRVRPEIGKNLVSNNENNKKYEMQLN